MYAALVDKRHLLFDLDGTLVDSSPAHAAAFHQALVLFAPALAPGFDYERVRGVETAAAMRMLGVDDGMLAKVVDAKREAYRARIATEVRPFAGARELLDALAAAGRSVHVVTSASRASAERVLALFDLAPRIAGLVAAEDAPRGKPDPAPYASAVARFALDATRTLAVEDAPSGVASARAAGLDVVLVHADGDEVHGVPAFGDLPALRRALLGVLA